MAAATLAISSPARALPNDVVLIMADDVGCGDLNCSPAPGGFRLPNLEALAARGITMTRAFAEPLCVPTRIETLLAEYPQRVGAYGNPLTGYTLPTQLTTMAERMRALGYATGFEGKYPVPPVAGQLATQNGYDESWAFYYNNSNYFGATLIHNANLTPILQPGHLTDALAGHAVDFLRAHRGQKRFLHFAPNAPHTTRDLSLDPPYQWTASQWSRCAYASDAQHPFCAMMVGLDDAVGAIMAELEPDALVIYVGDNGFDSPSNMTSPYAAGKSSVYDGGISVPMLVSWPGHLPAGVLYRRPVSTLDLYPTLTGADHADGVNLIPFLTGARLGAPHGYIFVQRASNWGVRSGPWKLVYYAFSGKGLLFNTAVDPGERHDVGAANPAVLARLKQALAGFRATLPPPR